MRLDRVQIPKTTKFVCRFLYRIEMESEKGRECICQIKHRAEFHWYSVSQVNNFVPFLRGSEPKDVFDFDNESCLNLKNSPLETWGKRNRIMFNEMDVNDMMGDSEAKACIECAQWQASDVHSLCNEFVLHCYPALQMSFSSFKLFMNKLDLQFADAKMMKYFRYAWCEQRTVLIDTVPQIILQNGPIVLVFR